MLKSIDPASGTLVAEYEEMDPTLVRHHISKADNTFRRWSRTSFDARERMLLRCAELLRERASELANLMAREMGKPVTQGGSEVEKCAWVCEYYAENGAGFLVDEPVGTEARSSFVSFRPIGVVLAVMPWNFPLWQVFRFAAPTLLAGNAALLKHASNVSGCALEIERIFREAGAPEGLFTTLLIGSGAVEEVIAHPSVRAVTLTGSVPAGRAVASAAGKWIKKSVLELGGSDPYLILHDADLELAATACAKSRLINSGQSCIAAKRFIVVDSVRSDFEELLVARISEARMGNPLLKETEVGPQARTDLRQELHDQVSRSIRSGARCVSGGEIPEGSGAFYPPTVLTDVRAGSAAYEEELFGPVAAVLPATDEADAIAIANDSMFGLGAAVFTEDLERGRHIARVELDAGCCFVNDFVRSDPRMPFGGVKESGYGRELSPFGIREFVNVKTVWVS